MGLQWSVQQGQHGFPITVLSGCHLAIVQSAYACPPLFCSAPLILNSRSSYRTLAVDLIFSESHAFLDLAAPWECLFVFDSIIFGLTLYNAYTTRRGLGRHAYMPIHKLLVRDGTSGGVHPSISSLTFLLKKQGATYFV